MDASSLPLSRSTVSHKQVSAPSSLSDLGSPITISWPISHTANTGVRHDDLICQEPVFHARSDNLTFQQQSIPSHRCRFHSEPVMQTVATLAEPTHYPFSSPTGAQNQRRRRQSFQCSFTPAFPTSATVSADRRCSTADTANSPSWPYCRAEPLQRVSDTVLIRGACASLSSWSI